MAGTCEAGKLIRAAAHGVSDCCGGGVRKQGGRLLIERVCDWVAIATWRPHVGKVVTAGHLSQFGGGDARGGGSELDADAAMVANAIREASQSGRRTITFPLKKRYEVAREYIRRF